MCGIAGFFTKGSTRPQLQEATDTMVHRGPDAGGYFYDDCGIGLGHRRLSIIDLSEGAHQPMYSADERYVMIYNGEVYNFQELRAKLPDHAWKTHGDSEVVLELFVRYGPESFAWLNGMFAVGIYDKQTEQLTIARDPVGIKPLYYYYDGTSFSFSSELKSIKQLYPNLAVNREAIPYFLHLAYIPVPLTIYKDVYKFPSGHYLEVSLKDGAPKLSEARPFWQVSQHIKSETISDEAQAKSGLKDILFGAVQRQLISDVPSGTFLSGGIDSSTVTAIATKVSDTKIKTFSIAVVDGKVNEAPYAAAIAKYLGTEHYELPIHQKDILDMVPDLLSVYDEPFGDTSAFPTMLVSKLARQHVTVALSGDGGDEQFYGYGTYTWAQRLQNPLLRALRKPLYAASRLAPDYYRKAGRMLGYENDSILKSHIYGQDYFHSNELKRLLTFNGYSFDGLNKDVESVRSLSAREKQSFWDMAYYLQDDLLVKVDRASMKYSLETRVPLLDLEVLKFSLNLHESLKEKNGERKYLLKQVLYDLVPAKYFDRPKWGFGIALDKALLNELRPLVEQYLTKAVIDKHGLVHAREALALKDRFYKGENSSYFRVWLLTVLHWWMEENG
ncbi:asparagine synthase (glutamine-hydrolyzing) [Flaviaesturariibacter aridisoli]|uniref:asparagine synthase (glutamine-hydrolyzing) n=1 Tax=Flaviaesturariibacter aridisoli TaxID=2545761 RepID=A0A4R4E3B6_9BACT|nr:asparagine synthase (glutamine-hydrolyzing) [Flaviaesturariibacter aridisoli]TCZ73130.1 asparagine synthase (glutamine-hydrolyzing) [Flaviaesturariibacter aridisoli]